MVERRMWIAILTLTCFGLSGGPVRAAEPPAGADPAAWALLERLADSEWVLDASWSDGSPLHARCVYSWGLNHKFVQCKTFVATGTSEYQRYESIMGWNRDKKSFVSIDLVYTGEVHETVMELADDHTFRHGFTDYIPDHPSPARQEISFIDRDHHTWKVWVKSRSGEWTQIMDGVWKRKGR